MVFSDDEDDTAELLAELQRIKKERAQEEARKVGFPLLTSKNMIWAKIWLPFFVCKMLHFCTFIYL